MRSQRKPNNYKIDGDTIIVTVTRTNGETYPVLLSIDDIHIAQNHTIGVKPCGGKMYAVAFFSGGSKRYLHRVVCDVQDKSLEVDHINRDPLDNTRHNLRIVTHQQNHQNKAYICKNNSSGFRGVYWSSAGKAWTAQIKIHGKAENLGLYKTAEEAAHVAKTERTKRMPYSLN